MLYIGVSPEDTKWRRLFGRKPRWDRKNVLIKAAVVTYDDETKEFGVSDAKFMNEGSMYFNDPSRNRTIQDAFKSDAAIEPDNFKKVTAEQAKKKSSSDANDPDKAEFDDK